MKRLLSTIHAEYSAASSARSTSLNRVSVLSNPLLITCGGNWAARRAPALHSALASATSPTTAAVRFSSRLIARPPFPSFRERGGDSFLLMLPPLTSLLSLRTRSPGQLAGNSSRQNLS